MVKLTNISRPLPSAIKVALPLSRRDYNLDFFIIDFSRGETVRAHSITKTGKREQKFALDNITRYYNALRESKARHITVSMNRR